MSNETEQRDRVMAKARVVSDCPIGYSPDLRAFAAVLLAQEAELEQLRESDIRCREALESAEHLARKQRTLLERCERERHVTTTLLGSDIRAHLGGTHKAGWSEVLGILQDGASAEITDEIVAEQLKHSAFAHADSAAPSEIANEIMAEKQSTTIADREFVQDGNDLLFGDLAIRHLRQRIAELEAECGHLKELSDSRYADVLELRDRNKKQRAEADKMLAIIGGANKTGSMSIRSDDNAERIEQWSAEIAQQIGANVAAIAELRQEHADLATWQFKAASEKGDQDRLIEKMQGQIDSLAARCRLLENEDQNQHDSLVDHGHAINQHREQINALEGKVERQTQTGKAAWMMEQAEKIDALTERTEKIVQAVLASHTRYCWNNDDTPHWKLREMETEAMGKLRETKGGE